MIVRLPLTSVALVGAMLALGGCIEPRRDISRPRAEPTRTGVVDDDDPAEIAVDHRFEELEDYENETRPPPVPLDDP